MKEDIDFLEEIFNKEFVNNLDILNKALKIQSGELLVGIFRKCINRYY